MPPQLKSNSQLQSTSELPVYYPVSNSNIYGREGELSQLKEYLSQSKTIVLYGIYGVGKTKIAVKLVDEVKDDFEYIYWLSLTNTSSLPQILSTILRYFDLDNGDRCFETKVSWLISFMQQHRCLLIFDNVDTVQSNNAEAEYSCTSFFSYLSVNLHQSCIILISRQKLDTVALTKSQSLLITGLSLEAGKMLMLDRGITAGDRALTELIERYHGHPLTLHLAATTVCDIFDGDVKEFLAQEINIFNEIETVLDRQIQQLSTLERSILYWLAVNSQLSLTELKEDIGFAVSAGQIVECLRKLKNYLFIERFGSNFRLQPSIAKYITNSLVKQACNEIEQEQVELLMTNALIKATAPEFRRQQQIEYIIKPIAEKLLTKLGSDRFLTKLSNLLERQRQHTPRKPGYLAGNIFNLLRYTETNLHQWNFSSLSVWQADGRDINLQHCNFAFADLTQSKFTEDFGDTLSLAISPDKEQLAACDTNVGLTHRTKILYKINENT